jgi:hypothetical protein
MIFSAEAEAFVNSIFLEDRSLVDLLTADHTFLNERLARHYGVPGVAGPQFRRVTLTNKERFGLLGKAGRADADFIPRPHLSRASGGHGCSIS